MSLGDFEIVPKTERISVEILLNKMRKKLKKPLLMVTKDNSLEGKFVTEVNLHRPGLALSGYISLFTHHRVQILGNTECRYLANLSTSEQVTAVNRICNFDIPLIFVTSKNELSEEIVNIFNEARIPLVYTKLETTRFMSLLGGFLNDLFALQTIVHGAMVDVYGIGMLITGKSGIGKSEVAMDLVERGHRLVADDVVVLSRTNNVIMAAATEMNKHFMEIRGLGIVDVMSMFGVRSIRYQKRLEVIIDLMLWEENADIDRTGLDKELCDVMEVEIPHIHLPISPGKNITVICEVIALNHLLKNYGYDPAKAFQDKIKREIARKREKHNPSDRAVDYFEGDLE